MRIREWSAIGAESEVDVVVVVDDERVVGLVLESGVSSVVSLLECASARVSAPARAVVELLRVEGGVWASRRRREWVREEAIVEKGL